MYYMLLILSSFTVTSWVWTSASASSDSFHEIFAQVMGCPADSEEPWSYRGDNGPEHWGDTYHQCDGARQSPIAVDSRRALTNENLEKLRFFFYDIPITNATIQNNGTTLIVIPDHPLGRPILLNGTFYGLYEIHFHWGSSRSKGSEHMVDGVQYAMEMHLVHRRGENEYAVVAVFFEQGNGINAELQHIVNVLPKVMYKDMSTVSRFRINLINLIPESPASFYLYNGSLTTPDCSEGVTWVLLKSPVLVGSSQIREFRKLFSTTQDKVTSDCRITGNIRPIQHLHRRRVHSSQ